MKKFFLIFTVFFVNLYAVTSLTSANIGNSITCPAQPNFPTTPSGDLRLFICPPLDINHSSELSDISGGIYECNYLNTKDYTSDVKCFYKSPVKYYLDDIRTDLYNHKNLSYIFTNSPDLYSYLSIVNSYLPNINLISDDDADIIKKAYNLVEKVELGQIDSAVSEDSDDAASQINSILTTVHKSLMDNIKSNMANYNRNYTFASFLGRIITLSPDLIKGVNPVNLHLEFKDSSEWWNTTSVNYIEDNSVISNVITHIKYFFHWITGNPTPTASVPSHNSNFYASSFKDFFVNSIWGYYYILMSNMDYLINKVAVLLLISIGGYVGVLGMTKSAINAKLNASGEFGGQTQSAKYSKLIGGMSLVTFFLLSPITHNSDGSIAFYTNDTIAKHIIRKMVNTGNLLGTLTNDAGLDAYLSYFANKEGLVNIGNIKTDLDKNIMKLANLKYETAIMKTCMSKYNKSKFQDFFVYANGKNVIPPENISYSDGLVKANSIKYSICQGVAKNLIVVPREVMDNIKYDYNALKIITGSGNDDKIKAIKFSITTMLLLNEKFGWVSAMISPVNDSIMKATDLYLMINGDSKTTNSEKFLKANAKSHTNISSSPLTEAVTGVLADLSVYSILPGFNGLYQNVSNIISSSSELITGFIKIIPSGVRKGGSKLVGYVAGFLLALMLWKISVKIVFSVIISLIILFKIVFYFKDVLMYFILSVFVPVLGYSRDINTKINKILVDGVVLVLYPAILVFLIYIFIFAEELFTFIFDTVFKAFAYSQLNVTRALVNANGLMVTHYFQDAKAFLFTKSIIAAGDAISIIFCLIIAYFILVKGPAWLLSKLGLNESAQNESANEQLMERGLKNVNPIT